MAGGNATHGGGDAASQRLSTGGGPTPRAAAQHSAAGRGPMPWMASGGGTRRPAGGGPMLLATMGRCRKLAMATAGGGGATGGLDRGGASM